MYTVTLQKILRHVCDTAFGAISVNITVTHILAAWHECHAARNNSYMQTKLQTWTGILINVIIVNVCNDKDVSETK